MVLTALQIILAVLLIASILLQSQGSGLSTAFGGGGEFYRSRRSMEKYLMVGTIILSIGFTIITLLLLVPHR